MWPVLLIRNLLQRMKWMKQIRLRYWVLPRIHKAFGSLTVEETFRKIYFSKAWGDEGSTFSSGAGSRGPASEQYCAAVADFIRTRHIRSVVDLGCGDFFVGSQLVEATNITYTGIDVVPELIQHLKSTVKTKQVDFLCADITSHALPAADLCLIRQVLQHLSNEEIEQVLSNVRHYPLILVSEDVPVRPKSFNRNKPHGPDVRGYFGSGVFLDQAPFSKPAAEMWRFELRQDAVLRTVLLSQ
jgi:SAM-dependent methyltransferase